MSRNEKKQLAMASSAKSMVVPLDRLFRLKSAVEGVVSPTVLRDLAEYLASEKGEIHYEFRGNTLIDQSGTKKHQVKCIISGWLMIADAVTLQPVRFVLEIVSNLVLVPTEEALPPLQAESEVEDYIVCGSEFDVLARIQEEILLTLPAATPRQPSQKNGKEIFFKALKPSTNAGSAGEKRESPFAKLAALKKSA